METRLRKRQERWEMKKFLQYFTNRFHVAVLLYPDNAQMRWRIPEGISDPKILQHVSRFAICVRLTSITRFLLATYLGKDFPPFHVTTKLKHF